MIIKLEMTVNNKKYQIEYDDITKKVISVDDYDFILVEYDSRSGHNVFTSIDSYAKYLLLKDDNLK